MKPRFVTEVAMDEKSLALQSTASSYDIAFEIYAYRGLTHDEVNRIVAAAYIMGNREGLVKGVTYKIVSDLGGED